MVSVARRSSSPPLGTAIDAGLRYLGARSHSRVELGRKLARKGFEDDEVKAALDRLTELGYLDDDAFARAVVRRRSTSRGQIAIVAELLAKGVSRPAADEAVAGFDPAAQLEAATRLAERLYAEKPPPGYREMLDRIGSKLARRGYSTTIVRAACQAVWARPSDGLDA